MGQQHTVERPDLEDDEEEQERLKEGYWDEGYCFLEEEGYTELDPETYIIGGIRAEEHNRG